MKNLISCFIVLFLSTTLNNLNAQEDLSENVKWGELFKIGKRDAAPIVIGHDDIHIYLIRQIKKKSYLEKYKISSLQLIKSVRLELEYNEKDLTRIDQFMFDDRPVLYTNFYNKKTDISYFFLQEINTSTLIPSKPKKVAEREVEKRKKISLYNNLYNEARARSGSSMQLSESGEIGVFFSSKAAAGTNSIDNPEEEFNKYDLALYSSDFELINEQEVTLPYEHFAIMQYKLAEDGILYLLGYEYTVEETEKLLRTKKSISAGDMHIIAIDGKTGETETVDIELEDSNTEILMIKLSLAKNGSFHLSGLTSNIDQSGVDGSFKIIFNSNFEEVSNSINKFPENFITQNWSEKKKKKLDKKNKKEDKKGEKNTEPVFYDYYIDYVIENEDGSTVMLAEQYYVRVVTHTYMTSNGGMRTVTTYYYYYNDIIAVKYDANGDFVWNSLIKKHQVSVNDGGYYSSYFVVQNGNDINIIYNDRQSNVDDTDDMNFNEKKKAKRNYIGMQLTLDPEGEQTRSKLFEFSEDEKLRLVPKICSDAGNGIIFLYAKGNKGDKLGTLTMDR